MTADEQRIAIATACFDAFLNQRGFVPFQRDDHTQLALGGGDAFGLWIYRNPEGNFWGCNYSSAERLRDGEIQSWAKLRNYLNSLDAMHEAEKTLNEAQQRTYLFHLTGSQRADDGALYEAVTKTAAQRAEAFLRTIGKYTEPTP